MPRSPPVVSVSCRAVRTVAVPTPALNETQRMGTTPGNRPLVSPEPVTDHGIGSYDGPVDRPSNNGSRVLLMKLARATRSGRPLDPSALAEMAGGWDALAAELQRLGAADRVA